MMNELFPTADFSDQSWIILESNTFSIEFSSGQENPVESLSLHVRGSEESIKEIRRLIEFTGWKALDTTSGEILDASKDMGSGLKEHNKFINQILRSKL